MMHQRNESVRVNVGLAADIVRSKAGHERPQPQRCCDWQRGAGRQAIPRPESRPVWHLVGLGVEGEVTRWWAALLATAAA